MYLLKILILFGLYFATAKFGLMLDAVSGFASLVWAPTGIAIAALLIFNYKLWPGIFAAALIVNFLNGAPIPVATGIAIGNTLEALFATYLLKRFVRFNRSLNSLKDVLTFVIFAAVLGTVVSATIGTSSLVLGNVIPSSAYAATWSAWWLGDILGALLVSPFLLAWSVPNVRRLSINQWSEIVVAIIALIIISIAVFRGYLGITTTPGPIIYFIFPILIWISVRFGQLATVTANLLLSCIAIWFTAQGFGPFITGSVGESLFFLQSFMGIIAVTFMILAAAISERKEMEERKDDFIALASHELKTPVTSLKMFAQALLQDAEKKGDKKTKTHLQNINKQLDRLTKLVQELLDISRIQAGKLEYQKDVLLVEDLIHETVEDIKRLSNNHSIIIEGKTKAKIIGDKDRLKQVLINLIINAIKYSPNSKKIIIHSEIFQKSILISVQDFGIGIPKDQINKLFKRFYQIRATNGQTYPGLGLGLYISKEIIERHNGTIWVESEKGEGSTFICKLPIKNEEKNSS